MEKEKTIYCGSGKKQNDTWIKATINVAKIKDHIEEFNGNKFVRLNINVKDQPDQYGKDVSISIDKWKPEPQNNEPTEVEGDLPF
jgi:hypothetical protein